MESAMQNLELPSEAGNQIYWLSGTDDSWFLAIGLEFQNNTLTWFDGSKKRTFMPESVEVTPSGMIAVARESKQLQCVPLTLDVYEAHIQKRLYPQTAFANEQEMRKALFAMKEGTHE